MVHVPVRTAVAPQATAEIVEQVVGPAVGARQPVLKLVTVQAAPLMTLAAHPVVVELFDVVVVWLWLVIELGTLEGIRGVVG